MIRYHLIVDCPLGLIPVTVEAPSDDAAIVHIEGQLRKLADANCQPTVVRVRRYGPPTVDAVWTSMKVQASIGLLLNPVLSAEQAVKAAKRIVDDATMRSERGS